MPKYLEFDTPATKQATELAADYGVENHGLRELERVFWNLPLPALVEEAVFRNEGNLVAGGPFMIYVFNSGYVAPGGTASRTPSSSTSAIPTDTGSRSIVRTTRPSTPTSSRSGGTSRTRSARRCGVRRRRGAGSRRAASSKA